MWPDLEEFVFVKDLLFVRQVFHHPPPGEIKGDFTVQSGGVLFRIDLFLFSLVLFLLVICHPLVSVNTEKN